MNSDTRTCMNPTEDPMRAQQAGPGLPPPLPMFAAAMLAKVEEYDNDLSVELRAVINCMAEQVNEQRERFLALGRDSDIAALARQVEVLRAERDEARAALAVAHNSQRAICKAAEREQRAARIGALRLALALDCEGDLDLLRYKIRAEIARLEAEQQRPVHGEDLED